MRPSKIRSMKRAATLALLVAFLLPARNAYAYLDPGSGSLILQMIIAALVAIPLAFKGTWQKLGAFFKKKPKDDDKTKKPS